MAFYLPKEEIKFVHKVMDELDAYEPESHRKSVLVFPPLSSRLRYLIHKTVEDRPELSTFSVGDSWCRRVVVCHSELRSEVEEDSDLENSLCEEAQRSREGIECKAKQKSPISSRSRGPKRPDKPLYMPRAARERLSSQRTTGEKELPGTASSSCSCISSSSDSCSCSETTENTKSSSTFKQESLSSAVDCTFDSPVPCPQEQQQTVSSLNEAEALDWDQTVTSFSDMTLEEHEKEEEDVSLSCSVQTDDTITEDTDLTEEIKAHLKEAVAFSIEHVHNDYCIYENVCINPIDFGHVIEIYDFPAIFKTDDLLDAFTVYSDGGMKIKWVDNTHALGVFSNESSALQALSICHPMLKVRSMAKASRKAKGKAIRRAEFIQPVKERPRTDCAVARRMVTRALGIQRGGRVQRY